MIIYETRGYTCTTCNGFRERCTKGLFWILQFYFDQVELNRWYYNGGKFAGELKFAAAKTQIIELYSVKSFDVSSFVISHNLLCTKSTDGRFRVTTGPSFFCLGIRDKYSLGLSTRIRDKEVWGTCLGMRDKEV